MSPYLSSPSTKLFGVVDRLTQEYSPSGNNKLLGTCSVKIALKNHGPAPGKNILVGIIKMVILNLLLLSKSLTIMTDIILIHQEKG
jgi:hypothetical protein